MTVPARDPAPIRVLMADDSTLVRAGLLALATHEGDIEVVAQAGNGREALAEARRTHPDVVLMDLRMPEMDGIEATAAIGADPGLADVRVLVLTTFDEDSDILEAIRAGASGYLLKDVAPSELRSAIRRVAAGEATLSPAVARTLMRQVADAPVQRTAPGVLDSLTEREREVLTLIGRGRSNQEVAAELFLSPATARTYASRLLSKLHARDRAQLVVLAYESGLVSPGWD
ncbi:response regulator [Occultella kanbiaonis]|uniref:response regulator n=1 Tax=Occultella kanbiaonis TaxID=2675754 RepID=UPI0012B89535|nr:response regulator transcription factor [Occultella kanbiaonis]